MKRLALLFFFIFFCFHYSFLSQNLILSKYSDSLKGFNESKVRKEMLRLNISPEDQRGYIEIEKKKFLINKYNLSHKEEEFSASSFKFGNGGTVMAPPCINEGFELGSIAGWTATVGQNTNSCNYPNTPTLTSLANPQHLAILTTPFMDPVAGLIPNSPFPGNRVLRINDGNINQGEVVKIRQTFNVTSSNFLYEFAYFMIAQNAVNHNCCNVPVMYVRVRDCIGNLLSCPNFSILAPTSTTNTCSGIGPASWTNTPGNTHFYNIGWQKYSIDLTSYIGSCVTIEVMVGDCALWGHAGYAYFDSNCTDFGFVLNGTSVFPAPSYTVNVTAPCGSTANIAAPGGLNPYLWNGPPLSGIVNATTQAINTSVPGIYTIQMTPVGVCNPIYRYINLTFTPNLIVSASPPTICSSGTNTTSTLTAGGASSYTWFPGGIVSSSIVVSPTVTTIYTVSAVSGSCSGSQTVQVTVQNSPTLTVSSNTGIVCSGGTVQLNASGATSYTWNPGGLTGATVIVTPTITTTYTVTGSNGVCNNSNTITINVIPGPTVSAFANPTIICSGNSANLFGSGASTYTWYPGGMTGPFISVSPTITTTYTVIGSVLSCTGSATVQVQVNNGPTVSVMANPTALCSGALSSVTLTASGGNSYTWNPGSLTGSQVVVNPTSTTVYTITSSNTLGCTSNTTFTYNVNPTPTLVVNPVSATICAGQSVTFTASGATGYTWNPGNLSGGTVVVSPTATTVYTVIGANGSCTSSVTRTVVVNPAPTLSPNASPNPVCSGNSVTLTVVGTATGYTWQPGNLTGTNVVVSPTATTAYTVTGVSALGCFSSAVVNVTVTPTPTLVVNPVSATICAGQSVTFTASGATGYTWNPGNLSGGTVVVSPTATTVYTVIGANGSCTSSVTRTVVVNPSPTVTASGNPTNICSGQSSTLSAGGATGYTWQPGNITGGTVVVNPTITTIYTVTGVSGGCTGSALVTVSVNVNPTINVTGSPTTVCSGSGASATLTATGANAYTWQPGPVTGSQIVITPTATTVYTVTGQSIAGCTNVTTYTYVVTPTPTLVVNPVSATICAGQSVTFTASGATGYTWNPGNLSGGTVVVSPTATTVYTVIGANGSCTSSVTRTVVVNPAPTLSPNASPNPMCSGNSVTLTVVGTATGYTWQPGNLTGTNVVVSPTATTAYTVTGVSALGCFSSAVVNVTVTPTPTLVVNPVSATICAGQSVTFTASGATGYTWNPGNLNGGTVVVSPTATTVYTVIGANGSCTSSVTRTVFVVPPPTLSISATSTNICNGQSTTLTATGATSYTWNPGSLTGSQVVVSPTITTNYTLIGANGSCTNSAVITVSVRPKPNINVAGNPTLICSGQSATLGAIAFPGGAGYTWTPGGQNTQTIVVSPSVTTQYTVTAINLVGCTNSSVITVSVNPTPTLNVSATQTLLCSGNSATLTGTGATTYTWLPGPLTGSSVIVSPTITTNYTVTGANGNCTASSVIQISVVPSPSILLNVQPSTTICAGSNITITPSGASSYTLNPGALTGSSFVVNPTISTIYTVSGQSSNGCAGSNTISVTVNPAPSFTINSNPPGICTGQSATLSVTGSAGNSYTWLPGGQTSTDIAVSPSVTTIYSLNVTNSNGCNANGTYTLVVTPVPTINATANPTNVCSSNPVTLTATGATNYTWLPGSFTSSQVIDSPTISTTYTVIGNNGGCNASVTINVSVTPGPQNVNASATGSITCLVQTVGLTASTTNTNVSYNWSGPSGFTSNIQNPSSISVGGNYTLVITDLDNGCSVTTIVTVVSYTSVPNFTAYSSGNLGCVGEVTVTASSSSTLTNFNWSGPSGFTSTASSFTTNVPGSYTVSASDPLSGCSSSSVISITTDTALPIVGATITPATCNGTVSNNDGSIILFGHTLGYKYDYVVGPTYTGSATYATATLIPLGGVIVNNLPNPSTPQPYTVRIFNTNGCYKDTTLILLPINCNNQVFGLTKAAATPSLVNNEYIVTFTVTAINNGSVNLNNITLTENLLNCFVSPTSFTVIQTPVITSTTTPSGLTANSSFDGMGNTNLVVSSSSTLFANRRDTITFSVRIKPNGYFGPFTNTVIGFATHEIDGTVFSDISNDGFNWDQNGNGTPTDDNQPTVINFTPNVVLGVTKSATLSPMQPDKTYFIYYTVRAHNLGNDTLKNVSLVDTIKGKTVKTPATYMIPNPPVVTTGTNATADAAFNGSTVPTLLISSLSVLPPASVIAVDFTVKVNPDTVKYYRNFAIGLSANGAWLGGVVKDTSNNGSNPDVNNNGNPYETSDNTPTDIYIPSSDIFVPDVFTPNGDGKNDFFVIKGLNDRKVRVMIFNRWGNKVYENGAYDNSWDGTPNVQNLTFGNGKVPAGVYYYIIEFLDHDNEKFTGYVVVQY